MVLQVDRQRFTLDGETIVTHRPRFGGLMSVLTIQRPEMDPVTLKRLNIASELLKRVDPAYDELDAVSDDFLADVADIAASESRLSWALEVKDPEAGPWEVAL